MGEGFAELLGRSETETELRRKQRKLVAEAFRSALRAIEKGDKYEEEEEEEEEDSDEEGNDFDDSDGSNAGDKVGRCLDFSYTSPLSPRLTYFISVIIFCYLFAFFDDVRPRGAAYSYVRAAARRCGKAVELATKANQCAASVETSLMEIIRARTQAEHRSVANMAKQVTRVA